MNVLGLLTTKNTGKLRICFSQKFFFSRRQGGVEKSNWPDCRETDFWLSKVLQPQVSHSSFLSSSDLTCQLHSQLPSSLPFRGITIQQSTSQRGCTVPPLLHPVLGRGQHYLHPVPPPASRSTPFPLASPQWWCCASTWNISTLFSNIWP